MNNFLKSASDIADIVGQTPSSVNLKVIDHIDAAASHWLSVSPLGFFGLRNGEHPSMTIGGGAQGFTQGDGKRLRLPLDRIDLPDLLQEGASFGSLFLAPGICETLRINGTVQTVSESEAIIAVEECYIHCAKALIRSDFWEAHPLDETFSDEAAFVNASRFMALATFGADGSADLSPKGDPAGKMTQMHDDTVWFADRPGNRRVDSFRNIVTQPEVVALMIVPGSTQVTIISGRAGITTDEVARERFVVKGKTPRLATQVAKAQATLQTSAALERVNLWPLQAEAEGVRPAKILATHVKANKRQGIGARIAAAAVSIPGLLEKNLEKDYKENLY
ncbi:MAG: pyridoxamine 5'-phosphate oxidase family protein [Chloroflexota bacterium]